MIRNITIFFVTVIFILFFLPVCFSQSNTNASGTPNASSAVKDSTINKNPGEVSSEATKENTEAKSEEKTAEEKKKEEKKAEKKKEEEKKAKEEEEKEKEETKEETPPADEENLDNWQDYAPTEQDFRSNEPSHDVWNDDQGFIDR